MRRIGKYEVTKKLGAGATSSVYLARDPFAQRDVAIKVISPEILRDPYKGKLYRHLMANEASLAGKLIHPHIAQIFDAVVDEDQGYIVMEYVPGGTLEQHCTPDALLPIERIVEIVFKCTRALDYAHAQGVTHRDVKPANILMSGDGAIKLSDFGAALLSTNDRTQVSGVGSPAYMSPQQVRELPLDHRTDIYSLGVVMYQLLTGRLPFEATNNYSMVYQITHGEPPVPSSLRREIPPSLDAVVARAMHKSLELRYQRWEEFSQDLAHAFRARSLKSRPADFADSEKFEALRGSRFFRGFPEAEIWEVVRFSEWDHVSRDAPLMKDGEAGDYFCFLAEGEVKVVKHGHVLNTLSTGECFGEMAVIGSEPIRSADVVAATDAKVMRVCAAALEAASEGCRMHFYQAFLEVLARRLGAANARIVSV